MAEISLLASIRAGEVGDAAFELLNNVTRTLLGLFGGVGVVDVGLGSTLNQPTSQSDVHASEEGTLWPPGFFPEDMSQSSVCRGY